MDLVVGLNGSGKTIYLENKLDELLSITNANDIITNVRNVEYSSFDEERIAIIKDMENYDTIFEYGELEIINNKLQIVDSDAIFTNYFIDIIGLLCRKGTILLLNEPDYGLYGFEITDLLQILAELMPTYRDGTIVAHNQYLFRLEYKNIYWCENYQLNKISREKLYEHIGQF